MRRSQLVCPDVPFLARGGFFGGSGEVRHFSLSLSLSLSLSHSYKIIKLRTGAHKEPERNRALGDENEVTTTYGGKLR